MKDIFVVVEQRNGNIQKVTLELIGEASKLAADLGLELKSGSAEDVDAGEAEGAYGGVDE